MERKFTEQETIRRNKLEELNNKGINVFHQKWNSDIYSNELKKKFEDKTKEELEEKPTKNFSISGRIVKLRNQGKAAFVVLQDTNGEIQAYLRKDVLTEEEWEIVLLFDLGDIVGVTGNVMKTKTNEVTIRANKIMLITKSLKPLPEKFHGLKDVEERYRRRYLDLIMNKESKNTFLIRSKIIYSIRNFLNSKGFIEVETPILQNLVSGAAAKPFLTYHNALEKEFSLRIATELPLKRLIVGGIDKVFEIGRIFRNEGISTRHNPEFTSIELYEAYSDVNGMMNITEDIIENTANEVIGTTEIIYGDKDISLKKPFKRIEMIDLIKEVTGVDFRKIKTFEEAKKEAQKHNVPLKNHYDSIGYIINEFFEEKCESSIVQPTFVTGYPVEVSPLAKRRENEPELTDRFELFVDGREYANAFSELNDPDDQYNRFLAQVEEAKKGNDEANDMDIDYIEALEYGMPPTGGMGLGIDRFVMLLTNSKSIRDVILFPHQKDK